MSLTLAGYTFTSPLAAEWATLDDHLYGMDTYGRQANWSAVESFYTAPFSPAGEALSDFLAPNGFGPLDLLYYYYGADEAKEFVSHATWGTGFAAGWDDVSRREMLTKGSAYRNVLYRVWQLLSEGVQSCASASVPAGAGAAAAGLELPVPGVYEWEAAWAAFAGSREGADGAGKGYSIYALGDKRCPQFKTCVGGTASGLTASNEAARAALVAGINAFTSAAALRATLPASDPAVARACLGALAPQRAFKSASLVGLVQGTLREAYEVAFDPDGHGKVEVAEGWAFAAPLLPLIAECDASVGETIHANMWLNADVNVKDGFAAVKSAIEAVYGCLGITCAEVGGMLGDDGEYLAGFEPCGTAPAPPPSAPPSAPPADGHDHGGVPSELCYPGVVPIFETPGGVALMVLTVIFGLLTIALTVRVLVMAKGKNTALKGEVEVRGAV